MENIHKILNYSFAEIDVDNYFVQFDLQRRDYLKNLLGKEEPNLINFDSNKPNEIANYILKSFQKNFNQLEKSNSNFDTFKFFLSSLNTISDQQELSVENVKRLSILQKKFEVNHRIFDFYNSKMQKISEIFQKVHIYSLFSIVLQLLFLKNKDYNYLNTSIKLNDLILKSGWAFEKEYSQLIIFSISLERLIKKLF